MSVLIDDEMVKYVASLARLRLDETQAAQLTGQMQQILAYVRKLDELDLDDVAPDDHFRGKTGVLREDVPISAENPRKLSAGAPDPAPPFVRAPRAIESEGGE